MVSAILLSVASEGLKPLQEANVALEKKKNVLSAVRYETADKKKKEIEEMYNKYITEKVVNNKGEEISGVNAFDIVMKDEDKKPANDRKLPLYIYTSDEGKKYYILPMTGIGLWGPIWGFISIDGSDFNTVYGSFFDHKGETPGLGAEISTGWFQQNFQGKKIYEDKNFVSVRVLKKGTSLNLANASEHRVDGISGGTITSTGVDEMLKEWIELYLPYFEKLKRENQHETTENTDVYENSDSLKIEMR